MPIVPVRRFSLKEAICSGTPLAMMPIFGEQVLNSYYGLKHGFAEYLHKGHIHNSSYVHDVISGILGDLPQYRRNMERMRALAVDRMVEPTEMAAFRINQVLKRRDGRMPHYCYRNCNGFPSNFFCLELWLGASLLAFTIIAQQTTKLCVLPSIPT